MTEWAIPLFQGHVVPTYQSGPRANTRVRRGAGLGLWPLSAFQGGGSQI